MQRSRRVQPAAHGVRVGAQLQQALHQVHAPVPGRHVQQDAPRAPVRGVEVERLALLMHPPLPRLLHAALELVQRAHRRDRLPRRAVRALAHQRRARAAPHIPLVLPVPEGRLLLRPDDLLVAPAAAPPRALLLALALLAPHVQPAPPAGLAQRQEAPPALELVREPARGALVRALVGLLREHEPRLAHLVQPLLADADDLLERADLLVQRDARVHRLQVRGPPRRRHALPLVLQAQVHIQVALF
mmetsp:Transcript_5961/g.19201  ORF Transcript_5961/g.19201 Transcript_5961/m.19201 type:complete len:245 (-) Transcript_5961:459-1193(-)